MDTESTTPLLHLKNTTCNSNCTSDLNSAGPYGHSNNSAHSLHEQLHSVALGLFLGLLCLLTTFMNLLVLYAVKMEKSLHTVGNLYIVSLSVADLIVGVSVMPLNLVYLLEYDWTLGRVACQFWLIMDYVASTASIFSVFILCLDRYRSVRHPLRYLKYRTRGRASVMISGAWLLSLLWIIPILGWRSFTHVDMKPELENKCDTDFRFVTWFKVVTAVLNFYIPSVLMLWFYTHIYLAVRQHLKERERIMHPTDSLSNKGNKGNRQSFIARTSENSDSNRSPQKDHKSTLLEYSKKEQLLDQNTLDQTYCLEVADKKQCDTKASTKHQQPLLLPSVTTKRLWISRTGIDKCSLSKKDKRSVETPLNHVTVPQDVVCPVDINDEKLYVAVSDCEVALPNSVSNACAITDVQRIRSMLCNNNDFTQSIPWTEQGGDNVEDSDDNVTLKQSWQRFIDQSRQRIQSLRIRKEHKAAKQLGFIIAAFMLCWIPYFIAFMVMAFCQECVHHDLHMFTIWLGYINSTLNPFIYPLCNDNFKKVFKKILHLPRGSGSIFLRGNT